jgi:hypothetical protein
MRKTTPVFLLRRADGKDIPLGRWLDFVASSSLLHANPPIERRGVNPFSKQPTIFRSGPGGAFFEGPAGRCDIEYHAGGLIIRGAVGQAELIVQQIAAELDADVQTYDLDAGALPGE